jgi:hypothetical protein
MAGRAESEKQQSFGRDHMQWVTKWTGILECWNFGILGFLFEDSYYSIIPCFHYSGVALQAAIAETTVMNEAGYTRVFLGKKWPSLATTA